MADVETKKWYASKTLWVNAIAILSGGVLKLSGVEIDAEAQVGFLAIVNLVLRIVTKSGLQA